MTPAHRIRKHLRDRGLLVAPGAYDGMTARLVAQAGFDAVYLTGCVGRPWLPRLWPSDHDQNGRDGRHPAGPATDGRA